MDQQRIPILPSIMCGKPWEIRDYVAAFEEAQVSAIHFDVMDGHYVPNVMLGANDFDDIRSITDLPFDVHLMCLEPEKFVSYFRFREGDWVSFHPEVCRQPYRLLQSLRDHGLKAGLVLSPGIPVEYVQECISVLDFVLLMAVNPGFAGQKVVPDHFDKLFRVKNIAERAEHKIERIVDGNTTIENAKKMLKAGATGFVTGTSSMMKEGAKGFVKLYREYCAALWQRD